MGVQVALYYFSSAVHSSFCWLIWAEHSRSGVGKRAGMGRENGRVGAALYCLVLCLVVAQMGWGFGMSFGVGGAYLVDIVRRVTFVARRMWGLELGSRGAEDVETGGREVFGWDGGR